MTEQIHCYVCSEDFPRSDLGIHLRSASHHSNRTEKLAQRPDGIKLVLCDGCPHLRVGDWEAVCEMGFFYVTRELAIYRNLLHYYNGETGEVGPSYDLESVEHDSWDVRAVRPFPCRRQR